MNDGVEHCPRCREDLRRHGSRFIYPLYFDHDTFGHKVRGALASYNNWRRRPEDYRLPFWVGFGEMPGPIESYDDLAGFSDEQLLGIRNLGVGAVARIRQVLARRARQDGPVTTPTQHTELRLRVGRETGHTLHLQRGEEPSDLDDFVGSVSTPELAAKMAEAWNAYWPAPENPWEETHVDEIKRKAVELGRDDDRVVEEPE